MAQRETESAASLSHTDGLPGAAAAQEERVEEKTPAAGRSQTIAGAHGPSRLRLVILACVALLPSFLKRPCYRLVFGYRIGKRVRIGVSILDARECEIADDVTIGHLNLVIGVKKISVGDHVRIGHLNILRGGDEVRIGRYAEIMRMNEINSIPEPDVVNPV